MTMNIRIFHDLVPFAAAGAIDGVLRVELYAFEEHSMTAWYFLEQHPTPLFDCVTNSSPETNKSNKQYPTVLHGYLDSHG